MLAIGQDMQIEEMLQRFLHRAHLSDAPLPEAKEHLGKIQQVALLCGAHMVYVARCGMDHVRHQFCAYQQFEGIALPATHHPALPEHVAVFLIAVFLGYAIHAMRVQMRGLPIGKVDKLEADIVEGPHHELAVGGYLVPFRESAHHVNENGGAPDGEQGGHQAHRYLRNADGIDLKQQETQSKHEEVARQVVVGVHKGDTEHVQRAAAH